MDTTGEQDDQEQTSPPESTEPIEDIYVYIVRDHEEEPDQPADDDVIETTLAQQKPSILALFPFFSVRAKVPTEQQRPSALRGKRARTGACDENESA